MEKVKNEKAESITTEELTEVTELQQEIQSGLTQVGMFQAQSSKVLEHVDKLDEAMTEFKNRLQEKYGPINVNLANGEYEAIEATEEAVMEPVK
jgi:peptidoglycan hydrolase CwlO-like protein